MKDYAKIILAEPLENYNVHLLFADSSEGVVSFAEDIKTGVFQRIADPEKFAKIYIAQFGTVLTWAIDAPALEIPDACADWLHLQIQRTAQPKSASVV